MVILVCGVRGPPVVQLVEVEVRTGRDLVSLMMLHHLAKIARGISANHNHAILNNVQVIRFCFYLIPACLHRRVEMRSKRCLLMDWFSKF